MSIKINIKLILPALILTTGTYLLRTILEIRQLDSRYIMDDQIIIPAEITIPKYVKDWMELRKNQTNLSNLGRILFLGEKEPRVKTEKIYQILVWKYGSSIERRLLQRYSNTPVRDIDPFKDCSIRNCQLTYNDIDLTTADIVIFHLHRTKSLDELPKNRGKKGQIWAFLTDESPYHTFFGAKTFRNNGKVYTIDAFNNIFNWSMSFRTQSDIPVPYGRTVVKKILSDHNANFKKRRDVLVAIMGSNCNKDNEVSTRWGYVKELQKHIRVDVYGKCGTLKCPGHFTKDCPLLDQYLFYLSFENSNCNEYITEKLWWNAYHKNSIPIVMGGGSPEFYKLLLPPNSYLNVEDFSSPASLARYILRLNETNEFTEYHKWRLHFEVLNEHGYFQSKSVHHCRVCEAMNYNDKSEKIYTHLEDQWGYKNMCHPAYSLSR